MNKLFLVALACLLSLRASSLDLLLTWPATCPQPCCVWFTTDITLPPYLWTPVYQTSVTRTSFAEYSTTQTTGFFGVVCAADTAKLAWDPSPSVAVAGYNVYYSWLGMPGNAKIDVGNTTTFTFHHLYCYKAYSFFVTAYDAWGDESGPSNVQVTPNENSFIPDVQISVANP